jgi:uncharacterized repeat protein (TIGR01451 family)
MVAEGGLIYTSGGSVVDPQSLTRVHGFGVTGSVAPDQAANRVAFLTQEGPAHVLRLFDLEGRREWGSVLLTNVVGEATDLVRCGADRLAFRSTGGQIFVLRTSSLPTAPVTDLTLTSRLIPATIVAGQTFELELCVSNLGPSSAEQVVVTHSLPPSITPLTVTASQGTTFHEGDRIAWDVESLPIGAVASNSITLIASRPGLLGESKGAVSSTSAEINLADNLTGGFWLVDFDPQGGAIQSAVLPARDLAWDPNRGVIYASLPASVAGAGNSLITLNPATGKFGERISAGADPGQLAITENADYLYVGLNATASVARVDLQSSQVDLTFPLNTGYQARDIQTKPGSPATVAIAREFYPDPLFGGETAGVALYVDGTELPNSTPSYVPAITSIAWSSNGLQLYGYNGRTSEFDFRRLIADANGLVVADVTQGLIAGYNVNLESAGGLVFAGSGTVLNPESLDIVAHLPGMSDYAQVKPNLSLGLLSFVTSDSGQWFLRQYRHDTYELAFQCRLPDLAGTPICLQPWGEGLAVLTTGEQIFLIEPGSAHADLGLTPVGWPNRVLAGHPFELVLTVTNRGPFGAIDTRLTNVAVPGLEIVGTSVPADDVFGPTSSVSLRLGILPPGSGVEISLTLIATNSVSTLLTNTMLVSSSCMDASVEDTSWHLSLWSEADNDRDGLPDHWEVLHGLNPSDPADAQRDDDGDGVSNIREYLGGTDPHDPHSVSRILQCLRIPEGVYVLFSTGGFAPYTIEASTALGSEDWAPLPADMTQQGDLLEAVLTNLPPGEALFLRTRLLR